VWTFPDGYNRNVELWVVVLAVPGRVSMESNNERWHYGIRSGFHGLPPELVLLDLEGLLISSIIPRHTIVDEWLE
jgi:hypothetical protein